MVIIQRKKNIILIIRNQLITNFKRKDFSNKKFNKKNKFKKKYNYHSKERRYIVDNKKTARY